MKPWINRQIEKLPRQLQPWVWLIMFWLLGFGTLILVAIPLRFLIDIIYV